MPIPKGNVLHDGDFRGSSADAARYSTREARAVYYDQSIGMPRHDLFGGKPHQTQDARKPAWDGRESDNRKIIYGIKGLHTFFCHLAAADTGEAYPALNALA
jgi:hypothetical protein